MIAAVLIAALAGVATYQYLNTVQERANEDARLVKVYVIKKDIAKGLGGDQVIEEQFVAPGEVPDKVRPATALVDVNAIRGKVALNDLVANQVLVEGQFVDPKVAQVTSAKLVPSGQVAITLSFDQVKGVAGLLLPGDKVNMIVSVGKGAVGSPEAAEKETRFLFQNVEILFIGANAAPQPGDTQVATNPGSGLITFAVPPLAAEKLAYVTTVGADAGSGIYLTLVPPDNQPVAIPPVDAENLFTGGLTPYEQ